MSILTRRGAILPPFFRWSARESMHEGIANHFSYAISEDGQQFLMNPFGVHFSKMKASDLLLLDARKSPSEYGKKVDPTAWWIHGAMHRNNPQARCIVHLHSHYATALSALADQACRRLIKQVVGFSTAWLLMLVLMVWA